MKNYTITLHNKWKRPYWYSKSTEIGTSIETSSYTTSNFDLAVQIAKDYLDVPEAELTLDEVKKQFDSYQYHIPETKLVSIQNYYNGRLAIFEFVKNYLKDSKDTIGKCSKKFEIPYKYNHFDTEDNDIEAKDIQLDAYLLIEIETTDEKSQ